MSGLAGALFGAWGTVNHYLVHWPRLRVALLALVMTALGVGLATVALRRAERRGLISRLTRRAGAGRLVFAGTFLVMLASGGGHLYTPDEWTIYAAAAGLVNHGVPAAYADEPYPLHLLSGPIRREGDESRAFSKYGIVPSLLAAPLYGLARLAGPGPDLPAHAFPYGSRALPLVPLLFGPLATAATTWLVFEIARLAGYSTRVAAVTAFAFAFGSLAWPFSKTMMSMSLAAGFLAATLWAVLQAGAAASERRRRWLIAAGAMAGLAVATRYETALFAVPLLALALAQGVTSHEANLADSRPSTSSGRTDEKARSGRREGGRGMPRPYGPMDVIRRAVLVAAGGLAVVLPLVFGMNALRTGSPLDAGYGGEGTLSSLAEKPWYGLFGILFSPGCGLVPHTPLMALGVVALVWFWEDRPSLAWASGAVALLGIAYYGSLGTWCGYTTWGPRYLVTVGPFLALPLAALVRRIGSGRRNPFAWIAGGGLFLWSAWTNLLAVLIDFNRGWQDHWSMELTYLEVTWLPYFTGITSHTRLLREWLMDGRGGLDLYLWHVPFGWLWTITLAASGLVCWVALWMAVPEESGIREGAPAATGTAPLPPASAPGQSAAMPARTLS